MVSSDDRGTAYSGTPPRRVVSLVPSLTEAIAATDVRLLAGATDWCTHPAGLDLPRAGGTKWPDVGRALDLRPDLAAANAAENPDEDLDRRRAGGATSGRAWWGATPGRTGARPAPGRGAPGSRWGWPPRGPATRRWTPASGCATSSAGWAPTG